VAIQTRSDIHTKVQVHVDGGSRGNPGPAAAAAVASTEDGRVLSETKLYIGSSSNNVAEYRAVLLGLDLALELGASEVCVVNDSELVARQLRGEYRVKNAGLQPLFKQTRVKLAEFSRWSIENVSRDQNTRADELVNEALDEAASLS
jgi:ribonuclease HI